MLFNLFSGVLALRVFSAFISFLVLLYVTRAFGVDVAAEYFVVIMIISLVSIFSRFGMEQYAVKEVAKYEYIEDGVIQVYSSNVISFLIILSVIGAIYLCLFEFILPLKSVYNYSLFMALLLSIPFSLLFYFADFLRPLGRNLRQVIYTLFLPNALTLLLLYLYPNANFIFMAMFLAYSIVLFMLVIDLVFLFWPTKQYLNYKITLDNLNERLHILGSEMMDYLNSFFGVALLSIFSSPLSVSAYRISSRLSVFVNYLIYSSVNVFSFGFAKAGCANDIKQLRSSYIRSVVLINAVSLSVAALISINASIILEFFSDELIGYEHILNIILLATIIAGSVGPVSSVFIMTGNANYFTYINIVATITHVAVASLLISMNYGVEGVAVGFLIAVSLKTIITYYYLTKIFKSSNLASL